MKSRAAIQVALKHFRRENHLRIIRQKSTLIVLAAVLLIGSFFHSLFWLTAPRTNLSVFSKPTSGELPSYLSDIYPWVPATLAQELPNGLDWQADLAWQEELENMICESPKATPVDPELQEFKQQQLCFALAAEEIPSAYEPIAIDQTDLARQALRQDLELILKGTPMEPMIEPISQQDRTVAAFLVGIGNKESTLGKFAPRKNGKDCYNYWGFKSNINPVAGGYACFSTPEQAVEIVGAKIANYIAKGRTTPATFTTWKCGNTCAGHSPESVASWVNGVSRYFYVLNKPKNS